MESLEVSNFTMKEIDITILNNFRDTRFNEIKVDRDAKEGIPIWKYANQID